MNVDVQKMGKSNRTKKERTIKIMEYIYINNNNITR